MDRGDRRSTGVTFDALYRDNRDAVYAYVAGMLGDQQEVESRGAFPWAAAPGAANGTLPGLQPGPGGPPILSCTPPNCQRNHLPNTTNPTLLHSSSPCHQDIFYRERLNPYNTHQGKRLHAK